MDSFFQQTIEEAYVYNGDSLYNNLEYISKKIKAKFPGNWLIYIQTKNGKP